MKWACLIMAATWGALGFVLDQPFHFVTAATWLVAQVMLSKMEKLT